MNKIWIVMLDDYEDSENLAAFSTRRAAHTFRDTVPGSRIEPLTLDETSIPGTVPVSYISINKAGTSTSCYPGVTSWKHVGFQTYARLRRNQDTWLMWCVETTDEKVAIDVIKEKWAAIIKAGVWDDQQATERLEENMAEAE